MIDELNDEIILYLNYLDFMCILFEQYSSFFSFKDSKTVKSFISSGYLCNVKDIKFDATIFNTQVFYERVSFLNDEFS